MLESLPLLTDGRDSFIHGNSTKDSNKGIANISWNSLNLPNVVTFEDGSTVTYLYAADGTKLRTVHIINGTTTQTDYCGSVLYENGAAKLWQTEAGYISMNDSKYHYYLQDHQGNNRVVVSENGATEEVNHYYAFGGLFPSNEGVQPFKYNGKELDTKKGLNWYDYGARQYNATLGRWFAVDPLAEKYYGFSPYIYCNNLPIRYIDPTGKGIKDAWETFTRATNFTFSVGYQAGFKIGPIGFNINAGSFQLENMKNSKITTNVSIGLGIAEIGLFDNVYETNNMKVKEQGWSLRIPYLAEQNSYYKEYFNNSQKIKTEYVFDKEVSANFDLSARFIIGFDFTINFFEIKNFFSDLFK